MRSPICARARPAASCFIALPSSTSRLPASVPWWAPERARVICYLWWCWFFCAPPNSIETRSMTEKPLNTDQLRELALAALDDLKAKDVKELDVRTLTGITDYMIIARGTSTRHVKSLADSVVEKAKQAGSRPLSVEGEREAEWILVALADVVVHVMLPTTRDFYQLVKLWDAGEARARKPQP